MMLESQAEHKKNTRTLNDMRRALYAEKHNQAQKAKEIRDDMMSSSRMSLQRAQSRGLTDRNE